jgi:hypothetical protein
MKNLVGGEAKLTSLQLESLGVALLTTEK